MSFKYPSPGQYSTAEYQASGLPYVTQSQVTSGSVSEITFPFVTNDFSVKNNSAGTLRVGFTRNGVLGTNCFTLPVSGSFQSKIRVTKLFLTAASGTITYEVVAGLTAIPPNNFFVLTGSYAGFSGSMGDSNNRFFGYNGLG
jgi:hypothetical protein